MKKVLYLCRSNGDLERIAAFVFLGKSHFEQTTLIDDFHEPVCDKLLVSILEDGSKVIRYSDLFASPQRQIFKISQNTLSPTIAKRIRHRLFKSYYKENLRAMSQKILNEVKPDLVVGDIGTFQIEDIQELYTQVRQDAVAQKTKVKLFQTGIHIFNSHAFNLEPQVSGKICDELFPSNLEEAELLARVFQKNLPKITQVGHISLDGAFLDYLRAKTENSPQFNLERPIISFYSTNISGIDKSLSREREIALNRKFVQKLVAAVLASEKDYRLLIKPHPRVDLASKIYDDFAQHSFVSLVGPENCAISLAASSEVVCSPMTSTMFTAIYYGKKVVTLDSRKYYPKLGSLFDLAEINFLDLESEVEFRLDSLKVSDPKDPVMKAAIGEKLNYNVYGEFLPNLLS